MSPGRVFEETLKIMGADGFALSVGAEGVLGTVGLEGLGGGACAVGVGTDVDWKPEITKFSLLVPWQA